MKILMISPKSKTLVNFRGDLIKEMVSNGHEVITVGPEDAYEEQINELGAKFWLLKMEKNSTGIVHDIKYMMKLRKIMKEETPDVVFSYTIKPVIYGTLAAKLAGVKNIYPMFTGLGYAFTSKTFKAKIVKLVALFLYRISLPFATKVFFQNKDDLNQFIEKRYINKEKGVLVNGSGVNMDKFAERPMPRDMSFLMIARIMKNKGVIEYLRAARIVKKKHPNINITLLGSIEDMQDSLTFEDIRPFIEDGSIEYFKETKDVRPYIENAAVFVLPSYREGTPRTVLESMAMGRPIITTNAPGCKETVIDGLNGLLVSVGDGKELAEKMIWMIENKREAKKMGQESLKMCKEKYDVKKVNRVMLETMKLKKKSTVNGSEISESI